jgi:hypothetical protein
VTARASDNKNSNSSPTKANPQDISQGLITRESKTPKQDNGNRENGNNFRAEFDSHGKAAAFRKSILSVMGDPEKVKAYKRKGAGVVTYRNVNFERYINLVNMAVAFQDGLNSHWE